MEITRERFIGIIAGGITIIAVVLYLFIYRPLIKSLKGQYLECKAIESEVIQAREAISVSKTENRKRGLIIEEEISLAIDELTKQGKLKEIDFVAMAPKQPEQPENSQYKILPIEMEIESAYEKLGIFLGAIDELKKSLVTVRSFAVRPDERVPAKLKAKAVLNMYLASSKEPSVHQGRRVGTIASIISAKRRTARSNYPAWGRNPFASKELSGKLASKLILNGILWDEDNPKALINDNIVGIGDRVEGVVIIEIEQDKVILNDGTNDFEIRL